MNTTKAWDEFKLNNYTIEPEEVCLNSVEVEKLYEIPESGRSTPKHNIPYIDETKVRPPYTRKWVSLINILIIDRK